MNIVILSDFFSPKTFGGAGIVSFDVARSLCKQGHTISVITTTIDRTLVGESSEDGLRIYTLFSDYDTAWRGYMSLCNHQVVGSIKLLLQKIKPDIVQANNIHTHLSYYTLKLAKQTGAKVFLTMHDVMAFHYGKFTEFIDPSQLSIPTSFDYMVHPWRQALIFTKRYNPLRNIIIRHYLRYADRIFAVSTALKEALVANGIGNVEVIHNGIDLSLWNISEHDISHFKTTYRLEGKKVIMFSGWVNGAKGGDQILSALKKIIEKVPNAVLLAVGRTDPYYKFMKADIEKYGLTNHVVFTGWLSGNELRTSYLCSDVVTFPSICFDTFGMVNLEGMAARKPVVATCFGGAPEVVEDGVTGYIVNPYNTDDMAEKIIDFLANPAKARAFGEAGYARAQNKFSLKDKVDELLAWYA